MPRNSYFRFKHFTIRQDQCAMKVCTDACVFGAWADATNARNVLDIGAGTGLLSLMVAQRFENVHIDAVEIDHHAFEQACENVEASNFKDRIKVYKTAIQDFKPGVTYDLIISNPPFYQNDLRSLNSGKNVAHHGQTLNFSELIGSVTRLLSASGKFAVLLPVVQAADFTKLAAMADLNVSKRWSLFHQAGRPAFRELLLFEQNPIEKPAEQDFYIYEPDGKTYYPTFKDLLRDFYIHF